MMTFWQLVTILRTPSGELRSGQLRHRRRHEGNHRLRFPELDDLAVRSHPGPQDSSDRTQIGALRASHWSLTTNPALLGLTLSQVPAGVALFIFKSDFPEDIPYGYDKDLNFVHPNPAPDNREN